MKSTFNLALFTVAASISEKFFDWLENEHYKFMVETNCYFGWPIKFSLLTPAPEGFEERGYCFETDKINEEFYTKNHQKKMIAHFLTFWGEEKDAGLIVFKKMAGERFSYA